MYGRKRHIKDINSRNFQLRSFAERTAMNHPMQGTAADIIKIAMTRVPGRLREEGLKSKLVLQIHDELDFEVPEDEIEALSELVRDTMQGVVELRVPLLADVSYGKNWAEAK
jgi:DNA polymerase-1